jgi:hypothetical protein
MSILKKVLVVLVVGIGGGIVAFLAFADPPRHLSGRALAADRGARRGGVR